MEFKKILWLILGLITVFHFWNLARIKVAFCRTHACLTNFYIPLGETEYTLEETGLTHRKLPKDAFLLQDRGSHHFKKMCLGGVLMKEQLGWPWPPRSGSFSFICWDRVHAISGFIPSIYLIFSLGLKGLWKPFFLFWAQFYFAKYSFKSPRRKPQPKPRARMNPHLPRNKILIVLHV